MVFWSSNVFKRAENNLRGFKRLKVSPIPSDGDLSSRIQKLSYSYRTPNTFWNRTFPLMFRTNTSPRCPKARLNAFVFVMGVSLTLSLYYVLTHRYNLRPTVDPMHRFAVRQTCNGNDNGGQWYNFSDAFYRLYIYSAFYDDRPSLLSQPVVRLIAISDRFEDMQKQIKDGLYCILQYEGEYRAVLMTEDPKPIGFGWPLNKKPGREYVYTCPTVKGKAPDTVSIASNLTPSVSVCVPVTLPHKPIERRDFGACVQAAYGTLDRYRLIEWLEVQKLLGVNLVGIYVLSADESTLKVLNYYSSQGFVELRKINYLYASKNDSDKEFWLHLTPAINDCMYRHMYEFNRILVLDFDEVITPRTHKNLSELVSYLEETFAKTKSSRVNYVFRNNYFFMDFPPDDSISPRLTVLRFRKKVEISPDGYSVKSMINPQACTHMHNHYCWGVTANYSNYAIREAIDPDIAVNQHYKKCHLSPKKCEDIMHNSTNDDVMMFLKDPLTDNVKKTIKLILNEEI